MADLCSICGHQHKHEAGERCSVCGHRKPTPSENLEMQNISPWMKLFTALFGYRSPVPQATTSTTTSQIPNNTEDLSKGLYLLQLKERDQPRN
ncbi:Protein-tyrosine-phosphatase protein [Dioscorea alata]|uniref:Protein-tyrosine-phosphatase protein n=1 Tax=Dioscorea alata TaxID=55571 RepID=A0ACB7VJA7_DIOAL|nr:Protein-tyrosine-phosphatase protein [Dioscorea alata]